MKLTALKLIGSAITFADIRKRAPRGRREDGRPNGPVGGRHKSCKSESRDDFELHIACFVCNTKHREPFG